MAGEKDAQVRRPEAGRGLGDSRTRRMFLNFSEMVRPF